MFDIGWSELVLIGIVALIVIGPKELPGALRTLGQWMGKLRRMASEFQGQFQEAMREAEVADLKKQVDDMTAQAQSYANFDPISDVRREIETTQQQIENSIVDQPAATTSDGSVMPAPAAAGSAAADPRSLIGGSTTEHGATPSSQSATAGLEAAKQEAGGKPG